MAASKWIAAIGCLCVAGTVLAQPPGMPMGAPPEMPMGAPPEMPMGAPPAGPGPGGADPSIASPAWAGGEFPAPPTEPPPIPQSWLISAWNPQPRWELRAEALFLKPDFEQSVPLFMQTQYSQKTDLFSNNPVEVDGRSQFIAAPRLTFEWHFNEFLSLETSGFILDGPNQFYSPVGATDDPFYLSSEVSNPLRQGFMRNLPFDFPKVADTININWKLKTLGTEMNLFKHWILQKGPVSDFALGLGGRYLQIQEKVQVTATDFANDNIGILGADTDNQIGGVQAVARARLQMPLKRWRLVTEGKLGLMANNYSADTQVVVPRVAYEATGTKSATVFSPLVEGNFLLEFFVSRNVTIFGGVQLLYLDRVSRGGGQFRQDVNQFIDNDVALGSIFYFGPRAGIVFSF